MVFTKYVGNPILDIGAGAAWDNTRVYKPTVMYRNHKWYMFYSGQDVTSTDIGLATSLDGITWTKYSGNPVLAAGGVGMWENVHVYASSLIYTNHKWYLYYTGGSGAPAEIGLATSLDGITWTKHSGNPILNIGAGGAWDDARVYYPAIVYRNHKWYMFYSGKSVAGVKIGLATSLDGITWTKHSGNPILDSGAGGAWDDGNIYRCEMIYRNHKWYMFYSGKSVGVVKIGLATSLDGITWTKHSGNPILDSGAGGTWDDVDVYNPFIMYRNHKWYMFYSGNDGSNIRIGLATSVTGV